MNPYQSLENLPDNVMEWNQDGSDEHSQAYDCSDLEGKKMYFADDELYQEMEHTAWNAHVRASLKAIFGFGALSILIPCLETDLGSPC